MLLLYLLFLVVATPTFGGKELIHPELMKKIDNHVKGERWNIMVEFKKPAVNVAELSTVTSSHQRAFLTRSMKEDVATQMQMSVMRSVQKWKETEDDCVTQTSLWITNELSVRYATARLILHLAEDTSSNSNISMIRATSLTNSNGKGKFKDEDEPQRGRQGQGTVLFPDLAAWQVKAIGAPAWLDEGFDGSGVIVGHLDGGVSHEHPELYNSWLGPRAGWHDPYKESPTPLEYNRKGTHTLSLIVGKVFGVAPGVRWTHCVVRKEIREDDEDWYKQCAQFLICPNPDPDPILNCSLRPNIISDSWIYDYSAHSPLDRSYYYDVVQSWRDVGIIPVYSIGDRPHRDDYNFPDRCFDIAAPSDDENVITVGGTQRESGKLSEYSRKGPPYKRHPDWPQRKIYKPDLVAGASPIYFASGKSSFGMHEGSEYASAVVAGAIALLLSRNKGLTFDDVKAQLHNNYTLKTGLTSQTPDQACGGINDSTIPNHKFGWGRLLLPDPSTLSFAADPPAPIEVPRPPPLPTSPRPVPGPGSPEPSPTTHKPLPQCDPSAAGIHLLSPLLYYICSHFLLNYLKKIRMD